MSKLIRAAEEGSPLPGSVLPSISAIPSTPSSIQPGAGGRLTGGIPSSAGGGDDDDDDIGRDGDFSDKIAEIKNPPHDAFIKIHKAGIDEFDLYRKKEGYDSIYYYIANKKLRSRVLEDIRHFKVVPYTFDGQLFLWVLSKPAKSTWYNSIAKLFSQPDEFYAANAVRIRPVQVGYEVRVDVDPTEIQWPAESTGELLAEAIGPGNIIESADHPIYRALVRGNILR